MKENYLKKALFLTLCFFLSNSFAQQARLASPNKIEVDWDLCPYTPTGESSDFKVLRSQFVKDRMENRIAPCSNFIVTYNGFTPEAQTAFQFAVDIWENLLDSPAPIRVDANFGPLDPGVLGGAGPDGFYTLTLPGIDQNTIFPSALTEQIIGEEILVPPAPGEPDAPTNDINATFSSTANFYFGTDGNTPSGQIDFVTVVLHELGHGLGVLGLGTIDPDNSNLGLIRRGTPNVLFSIWDTFINGTDFLDNSISILDNSPLNFPDPSGQLLNEFESGDLTCVGPIAVFQNGGVPPPTYAPPTFNSGSSYSHWDEGTFNNTPNALMTPFVSNGEAIHDPGDVTLGFMEDMGWTLCDRTLSINDNLVSENITVSPNPFNREIIINLPQNSINDNYKISIIDINGRQVFNKKASVIDGKITLSGLESLKQAVYFVEILNTSTNSSITKKLIKI